jgi:acetylornithine deacetylase/succinyl-diaminopimelate desuccinylase-like protein
MRQPPVKAALGAAKKNEPHTIEQQIHICEIAAPPFHEFDRARELMRQFTNLSLANVHIDQAGNVIGTRPGRSAHPNIVFAAHLDTVFPEGTDVKVKREGETLKGPGIGDDCRGLAVILATIQALNAAKIETAGTITFVADVGEEGLGDLRGIKNLFRESASGQIDKFVSIDGNGLSIANTGVGSMRYRVAFTGPGGHSYGAFGMANPIHAMGRAIAKISDFQVPASPKTTFNVGRVGGGTSVNSIASEAWMEMDMRSSDVTALKSLDEKFQSAIRTAVEEENRRWNNRGKVSATPELVGLRPAGKTPEDSPLVQTALAVTRAIGGDENLQEGSTDANVPMSMNIPAITIGGGGAGSGAHSTRESFNTTDTWRGTERAVLLAIALAQ